MDINFKYHCTAMAVGLCSGRGCGQGAAAKATHWECFTPIEIKLFRSMNSVIYFRQT